ncbi:MAG TPA: DUF664 domain-containing protein [Actinomycetota bacterium]|nr:DUF664 domain-containing protein [Actinomycetota bacterium]
MADPILAAARSNIGESLDELRRAIDGLSSDALNDRLAGEGTNPMAVIVTHALESTRAWLSLATGAPIPERDRPAEFRAVADDGFPAWVEGRIGECLALLDGAGTFDPAREHVAIWTSEPQPRSAAWALLHATAHLGEHVGHAHVMRDLVRNVHA